MPVPVTTSRTPPTSANTSPPPPPCSSTARAALSTLTCATTYWSPPGAPSNSPGSGSSASFHSTRFERTGVVAVAQVAKDYTNKELMAAFVAGEVRDGETVSVGASLPVCRAGILLAHLTHAPNLKVQMSFTMTNLRNVEVLESFEFITDWRAARWAEFYYSHDVGPD